MLLSKKASENPSAPARNHGGFPCRQFYVALDRQAHALDGSFNHSRSSNVEMLAEDEQFSDLQSQALNENNNDSAPELSHRCGTSYI